MKLAFTLALLALLQTSPPVPREAVKNGGRQDNSSQGKGTPKQPPSSPTTPIDKPESANPNQQTNNPEAGENEKGPIIVRVLPDLYVHKDRADYIYIGSNLILTLITLGIALIAWRQATAGKISAQAIMASERAWIIVSPPEEPPPIGHIPEPPTLQAVPYAAADIPNIFMASIKNTGNTPGQVIELRLRYRYAANRQDIPNEPDYGPAPSAADQFLLVKGDSIGAFAFLEPNPIVTMAEMLRIRGQEAFLYSYGIAVYEDAFKQRHETRFGWLYHFPLGGRSQASGL